MKKERPLPEDSTSYLRSPLDPKVTPWLSAEMHFFYFNLNLTGKIENKGFYESLHTQRQNTAYLSCCTHPAQYAHTLQSEQCIAHYMILEVRRPTGPQLLVGGPSGWLDFVLRALRALRPRLTHQTRGVKNVTNGRTDEQGDSRNRIFYSFLF